MKLFCKKKKNNGRRHIYFCGLKIFSYKKKKALSKYDLIYAKRFDGLTENEMRYCLEEQFKNTVAYPLNLDNPQTFNEKLQWLKLYYHRNPNPLLTQCADKVGVREYVKEKIGEEYLIPCLGVWDNPDDIDFDRLPNQFVLKVNWGSGQNIIVKDKSKLDIDATKNQLAQWMKPEQNHYFHFFEPCYKNIQPKIIAEKYIEQMDGYLVDYKIHCFHGEAVLAQIIDRWETHKETIYTVKDWQKTSLHFTYHLLDREFKKTKTMEEIEKLAPLLSSNFPYARIDFYDIDGKLYFGEITFFPGAGMLSMSPDWGRKLGDLLILPKEDR